MEAHNEQLKWKIMSNLNTEEVLCAFSDRHQTALHMDVLLNSYDWGQAENS